MPADLKRNWFLFGVLICSFSSQVAFGDEGDECKVKPNIPGICRASSNCLNVDGYIRSGALSTSEVPSCGYGLREEIICCPIVACCPSTDDRFSKPNSTTGQETRERPAVAACRKIRGDTLPLGDRILDGVRVGLGVYPHMAAIAYNSFGTTEYRCGGSLIDDRYVLTAAHCISEEFRPAFVRLGAVNLNEPDRGYVDINVNNVLIHPNYVSFSKYYDIAILELAEAAPRNDIIRPACLNTDIRDPPLDASLYVAGWGQVNRTTKARSTVLLRAPLELVPLSKCNEAFANQPTSSRSLKMGIIESQMCAADRQQKKDACQGDSGGPLIQEVNITDSIYYIQGVISAGIGCASATPGLYSRVAAFLDYIEGIVWPDNRV
ncbi:serine protease persephone isoform X2 [Drosophila bipectinata]|uniref:serine protease persephone isoform X2 n=1 Tax=Drosophila bipectinata TaxID=42026 RepID=UPI001C893B5A|nr:serine protease Hayan isoform X2 [Drosophila bipectinata]